MVGYSLVEAWWEDVMYVGGMWDGVSRSELSMRS